MGFFRTDDIKEAKSLVQDGMNRQQQRKIVENSEKLAKKAQEEVEAKASLLILQAIKEFPVLAKSSGIPPVPYDIGPSLFGRKLVLGYAIEFSIDGDPTAFVTEKGIYYYDAHPLFKQHSPLSNEGGNCSFISRHKPYVETLTKNNMDVDNYVRSYFMDVLKILAQGYRTVRDKYDIVRYFYHK
jgi:hypothetical protein